MFCQPRYDRILSGRADVHVAHARQVFQPPPQGGIVVRPHLMGGQVKHEQLLDPPPLTMTVMRLANTCPAAEEA